MDAAFHRIGGLQQLDVFGRVIFIFLDQAVRDFGIRELLLKNTIGALEPAIDGIDRAVWPFLKRDMVGRDRGVADRSDIIAGLDQHDGRADC